MGAVNTSIPAGRGNPPTKEPTTDNNKRRYRRESKHTNLPSTELVIQLNGGETTENKQLNKSQRKGSKHHTNRRTSSNTTSPHVHNRIQDVVHGVNLSQLAGEKHPPKKDPQTIKNQIHPENQHKWHPKSTKIRRSRRLYHWISQVFYHRSLHHKPRESEEINLKNGG